MACFSRKIEELNISDTCEGVYKTSVENVLFENNRFGIIRHLKHFGFQLRRKNSEKILDTFVQCCSSGDLETVDALLNIIPDLNIIHRNKAPIHYACEANQADVVKLLVSHGARVNSRDTDFETPIHIATRNEYTPIVEMLIQIVEIHCYRMQMGKMHCIWPV
ncbi:unnamed protein product [Mytilus edulis]|uniref:Uncharacterized protein n=1 Tax=Mytilus edulis TaxID=6550 RepID=A0A8S3QXW0_MYTED|nr:unnamed protein product [Mytilus edulis]